MSDLWSISPIDGRYKNSTEEFRNYFSEAALIKYRIIVECEYFISLCEVIPPLFNINDNTFSVIRERLNNITEEDLQKVKDYEKETAHDVKQLSIL